MASLGMSGPYIFTSPKIDEVVTKKSPGNYALGHTKDDGTIHIFYKGEELPYKLIVPQEDERYAPSQMEALAVGV